MNIVTCTAPHSAPSTMFLPDHQSISSLSQSEKKDREPFSEQPEKVPGVKP